MPELVFDQIDTAKGTGRLIGNIGVENVQVLKGHNSIHIVEITKTGNMNITTIFDKNKINYNEFPVVHSRQMYSINQPLPSQYVGLCKKLL